LKCSFSGYRVGWDGAADVIREPELAGQTVVVIVAQAHGRERLWSE
jgi:hypothetical protein